MKHKHHIVPRHVGGTDDPSNIIELTVEEHAEAHRKLYEEHGRWQDKVAWLTLSGYMNNIEAIKTAQRMAKNWLNDPVKKQAALEKRSANWIAKGGKSGIPWNKGKTKDDDTRLKASSTRNTEYQRQGKLHCIGDSVRGKQISPEQRTKLSEAAKQRKRVMCPHCNREFVPQTFARYHGINCSQRINIYKEQ